MNDISRPDLQPELQSDLQSDKQPASEPALERALVVVGSDWYNLTKAPISASAPAGKNVRLEPLFEQIESEIAKLESLTDDSPIEWDKIKEWSGEVLKKQAKDILVACYLGRALCQKDPLHGLLSSVVIHLCLVSHYWSNGFPPERRIRGRSAAYNWWIEQCAPLLEEAALNVGQLDKLVLLAELLESLDAALLEHMGEAAPASNELLVPVKRHIQALQAEKNAQTRRQEKSAARQPLPGGAGPLPDKAATGALSSNVSLATTAVANEKDLQQCYRSAQDLLRGACQFIRKENLSNPESYRINRFVTWLGVSTLPPATNGVTQLRPLSKEKLQHYEGLIAAGSYRELIPDLEVSLSKAPYWLSGHLHVYRGLTALGYTDCALVVAEGVKSFVDRFPGVTELKFNDKTEFADSDTRQWLQFEVLSANEGAADNRLPVTDQAPVWEAAYQQALQLHKEKKTTESFKVFQDGCRQAYSQRELAFWRYHQARFCFESGQINLAIAVLENLQRSLEKNRFDQWEPGITAKIIELLIRSYQRKKDPEISEERVSELQERLCLFDLETAYELSIN